MKNLLLLFLFSFSALHLAAQDDEDLLSLIEGEPEKEFVTATFKTNRIVNGHSVENTHKGVLDFKISHRFAPLNQGLYDLFGLDGATIRFGLDYGITDRLMIGVGRNSREKIIEGFAKYKILAQATGPKASPVTLNYLVDAQIMTARQDELSAEIPYSRMFYTHQLLIGRKFSQGTSVQIAPTLVHRNLVDSMDFKNDVFAIGIGARQKLNKRVTFNLEYYYVLPNQISDNFTNSLSLGFDIETGGHVFQLHFTNSADMTYKGFITETSQPWFSEDANGNLTSGIRFGFNISRVFTIVKPKEF